jgi:cobalt-zinc-cadmium efflux system outer membrane protein
MPEHPTSSVKGTAPARGKRRRRLLLLAGLVLSPGCLYRAREATDETVRAMATRPYDLLPSQLRDKMGKGPGDSGGDRQTGGKKKPDVLPEQTVPTDVKTAAYLAGAQDLKLPPPTYQLQVPGAIPGSDTPLIKMPDDRRAREAELRRLYEPLEALPEEIRPQPGPSGLPFTLSDFQRLAAENSPTLRQAATDVQGARGAMIQAATYPNPTMAIAEQASNNNSLGGALGFTFDQTIVTGGKMKLAVASAKKALDNAELALKRARSDLSTQVRNAYFALLVAKETMRVTRALSVMTDEVYRVQLAYTERAGLSAAYEPAALRAQAYSARLAYFQSRATYIYAWKSLVAVCAVRQLPLSDVDGRIDSAVPYYEFDKVLAHALTYHTDMLSAKNGIPLNQYNLKLAQVTPFMPNLDVNVGMFKDRALFPIGTYHQFTVGAPIPLWDQNRGNILTAEATLARALEEPHRVEMVITNNLSMAYANYRNNLAAMEYYRRYILPDQMRAYRGVLLRRQVDQGAQFNDLVTAQQTLATSVTTYLGLLGSLWSGVISVADFLQTDDLFQTADPASLPPLPDLNSLPPLPCCHPFGQTGTGLAPPPAGHGGKFAPGPAAVPALGPQPPVPGPAPTPWAAPGQPPPAPVPPMPAPVPPFSAPAPVGPRTQGSGTGFVPEVPVPPALIPLPPPTPVGPRVPMSGPATGSVPSVFFLFFCNAAPPPAREPVNVSPDELQLMSGRSGPGPQWGAADRSPVVPRVLPPGQWNGR